MTEDVQRKVRFQGAVAAMSTLVSLVQSGSLPLDLAEVYAAGMLDGVRDFLTAYRDQETAYNVLQRSADRQAESLIPKEA